MKRPVEKIGAVTPAMEVWTKDWRFMGVIEDRGTEVSLAVARERFGSEAYFVLPALVEGV